MTTLVLTHLRNDIVACVSNLEDAVRETQDAIDYEGLQGRNSFSLLKVP
jgi:hypothetical protein